MDNIFTGETSDQATEKHNLRLDYAAVLQEQIREQNEKKERLKQQKLEEQRLEREEMDRMRSNSNQPKHRQNNQQQHGQQPPPSPDKATFHQQPQHPPPRNQSPTKPPAVATTTQSIPPPMAPQSYDSPPNVYSPAPPIASAAFSGPLYTPPPLLSQWRAAPVATPELDAIQRLRQELEDARKLRSMAQKQVYQKPNFMLPQSTTTPVATSALKASAVHGEINSPSPRGPPPQKGHHRRPESRPTTPAIDELELGMSSNNNQLESSSSFVAVTLPEKSVKEGARGGAALQGESCFVPLTPPPHASVVLQPHGRIGQNLSFTDLHNDKLTPKDANLHCNNLEDSIDDIDAILHAFLAKKTR